MRIMSTQPPADRPFTLRSTATKRSQRSPLPDRPQSRLAGSVTGPKAAIHCHIRAMHSPINEPLEQVALAFGQFLDVGHQEAVALQVQEHLAACAEVLRLVLGPAHREIGWS